MKRKELKKGFYSVFDETLNLTPTYPQVRLRIQSYVILGSKSLFIGWF